ncbi:polysaccharide pyruvyl transferase family protein [Oceanobacillus sp. CF4.6]|uniref:polysaccharide pyruvyl transferase family protein n=1 Tax=Oceanobacillus sp. CF4.6 TaxID=3373080 RepID=UPI003EE65A3E
MKRIFVDIYLAFNLGDDLFLDILARKYPDCEIVVNHVGSNYDQFLAKYKNVKRRKYTIYNKIAQRLGISDTITNYDDIAETHDALVFVGGSIFREEPFHPVLYKERMKIVTAFKKRNKSVFILGANFGPYTSQKFIKEHVELFKLCDDVCFRDMNSYNIFKYLPQVRYAPDIVFQMDVIEYKNVFKKNVVGFSIIDVRHKQGLMTYFDKYIESTVKSINILVDKGYECCLTSFCDKEGDLEIINLIRSKLSPKTLEKVTTYNYQGDLSEALHLIATFNLFIAARFHANILALLLGIGLVPIIYSDKTSNMLNDIGFNEILVTMDKLKLQYDERILDGALDNRANLEFISESARDQFKGLHDILKSSKESLETV